MIGVNALAKGVWLTPLLWLLLLTAVAIRSNTPLDCNRAVFSGDTAVVTSSGSAVNCVEAIPSKASMYFLSSSARLPRCMACTRPFTSTSRPLISSRPSLKVRAPRPVWGMVNLAKPRRRARSDALFKSSWYVPVSRPLATFEAYSGVPTPWATTLSRSL